MHYNASQYYTLFQYCVYGPRCDTDFVPRRHQVGFSEAMSKTNYLRVCQKFTGFGAARRRRSSHSAASFLDPIWIVHISKNG